MTINSTFTEEVKSKSISSNPYVSNVYSTSVNTTGSGVGGRFGFIISPIDYFRFGLSYQTPIRVNLTDTYSSSNSTNLSTKSFSATTGDINSTYQIITPGKLTLSGLIMIPKHGFISADYEIIDYRDGQIKSTEFQSYFETVNTKARAILAQSTNLRIGGEYRWDNYRFRSGYNLYNSPYNDSNKSIKQQSISTGLGMLWGNGYFIDAACVRSWGTVNNSPYDEKQSSQIDLTKYTFMLSGGIRF
jgi:long-subunit fatty acid transport protein